MCCALVTPSVLISGGENCWGTLIFSDTSAISTATFCSTSLYYSSVMSSIIPEHLCTSPSMALSPFTFYSFFFYSFLFLTSLLMDFSGLTDLLPMTCQGTPYLLSRHVPTTTNPKVCHLTSTVLGRLCSSALRRAWQW